MRSIPLPLNAISRNLWVLALTLILLGGCSLLPKTADETENWSVQKFYKEANSNLTSGNYEKAIELYKKLEARYPLGIYAQQAQLEIAYAYYKYDEPVSATAALDRFIKLHPRHPYVDYAYYLKGMVSFNQGTGIIERFLPTDVTQRDAGASLQAFDDFKVLVERYPDSLYSEDARARMLYLRNNLAAYEVHVARYYMKRGAWLAAVNRANYVLKHYQRTPAVEDALGVMIRCYEELELQNLADDARRVLDLNRSKKVFVELDEEQTPPTFSEKAWEFLQLDK